MASMNQNSSATNGSKKPMDEAPRVLICGGSKFGILDDGTVNQRAIGNVNKLFDKIISYKFPDAVVEIVSASNVGVETYGVAYAKERGLKLHEYEANVERYGNSAGAVRNHKMLFDGRPDLVIALAGGAGTRHMKAISMDYGVEVLEVSLVKT